MYISVMVVVLLSATQVLPAQLSSTTDIVKSILNGYDKTLSPFYTTGRVVPVSIGLNILEIYSIDDSIMQYSVDLMIRRYWTDPRLRYDMVSDVPKLILRGNTVNKFWLPDVYFQNARSASVHNATRRNELFWVQKDGSVYFSTRITVVLQCSMDLHSYPMDWQSCGIQLESYSYYSSEIMIQWMQSGSAIQFDSEFDVASFTLKDFSLNNCDRSYAAAGTFPCIQVVFYLKRDFSFQLITLYFPTCVVVWVSYVSFWLSQDAVPARIGIASSSMLTAIQQAFVSGVNLPKAPYIKAIDIWLAASLFFIMFSLVEYGIISVLMRAAARSSAKNKAGKLQALKDKIVQEDKCGYLEQVAEFLSLMKSASAKRSNAEYVDMVSRVLFPVMFFTFFTIYWLYFLVWNNPGLTKTIIASKQRSLGPSS